MADTVAVVVDARQAIQPINQVGDAAQKAQGKLNGLGGAATKAQGAFARLKTAGSSLQGVLAGIGAGAALKGIIGAGVESDRTAKRLKLLSTQYGESEQLAKFAGDAAEKFSIGNTAAASSVADLYGRLRPAGVSLKEIQTTFTGVNVAAAQMNLSAAETEGVMLQLSQALGSGTLQGDEFRSVMERLPAIGQAIAGSLGVTVGELKQLGADGKLTTDVIIEALQGLANQDPPPADAYKIFKKELQDLSTAIGKELLPAFTPLVKAAGAALDAFGKLPGPVKTIVAGFVAFGGALAVVAPILGTLGPVLGAIGTALGALVSVVGGVVTALTGGSGLLGAIAAVFTGPVGWAALLVGAGVAIFAFRDQIFEFLRGIAQPFIDVFAAIGKAIRGPFEAAFNFIKSVVNAVLRTVASRVNFAIGLINRVIKGANRLPGVNIPLIPKFEVPQFGKGGMVNGAQLAIVGEEGPEYIVPQNKAEGFAANILAGMRGPKAIPAFAEGGFVGPVNISTGPVMQQDGTNYVTMAQFEAGIRDATAAVLRGSRSYGSRRFAGIS